MRYNFWVLIFFISYTESMMADQDDEQITYFPTHEKVEIGSLVTDLRNFDYAKNSFDMIFYVWWNSADANYHPDKIMEIINAFSFEHKNNFQTSFEEGLYNTSVRYYATIHHHWDMREFPFDRQILKIKMEDGLSDIDSVRFIPDVKNSRIAQEFLLPGWEIESFSIKEEPFTYSTNFGNNIVDNAVFSRVFLEIDMKRSGMREFINYFIAFFIGVFLIGLGYFIYPSFTDAKFSLALSAIFAAMANKYILDGLLPITPDFTLSDNIQLLSFSYIIIGSAVFTIESILMEKNRLSLSLKINYIAFAISTLLYILILVYSVWFAVAS